MQYWAVARTAPNASPFESVGLAGFETFVSRIRVKVGAQWRTAPLFGCYFFVRMVDRWRVLERTIGVLNAVKFGASPARRPDRGITALLDRADPDGVTRLSARPLSQPPRRALERGAHVAIAGGPFRGFEAIHMGMTAQDREVVLINLLGRQTPVKIAASLVVPSQ